MFVVLGIEMSRRSSLFFGLFRCTLDGPKFRALRESEFGFERARVQDQGESSVWGARRHESSRELLSQRVRS